MDPTAWFIAFLYAAWLTFLEHWALFVLGCAAGTVVLALIIGKAIDQAKTPEERAAEDEDQAEWIRRWDEDH